MINTSCILFTLCFTFFIPLQSSEGSDIHEDIVNILLRDASQQDQYNYTMAVIDIESKVTQTAIDMRSTLTTELIKSMITRRIQQGNMNMRNYTPDEQRALFSYLPEGFQHPNSPFKHPK
jgi:hypothetical protein